MQEFLVALKKELERMAGREIPLPEFMMCLRGVIGYAVFDTLPLEAKQAVWGDDYYTAENRRRKHGTTT